MIYTFHGPQMLNQCHPSGTEGLNIQKMFLAFLCLVGEFHTTKLTLLPSNLLIRYTTQNYDWHSSSHQLSSCSFLIMHTRAWPIHTCNYCLYLQSYITQLRLESTSYHHFTSSLRVSYLQTPFCSSHIEIHLLYGPKTGLHFSS